MISELLFNKQILYAGKQSIALTGEQLAKKSKLCFWICSGMLRSSKVMTWFYSTKEERKQREVTQSYPTLCDPVDSSLPGSFIHGILQARILEWVAISFSSGSSRPRDQTRVSHIVGRLYHLSHQGIPL